MSISVNEQVHLCTDRLETYIWTPSTIVRVEEEEEEEEELTYFYLNLT